jgi:lipoprotein-anchoring transpeptidase ErfK/SrfK
MLGRTVVVAAALLLAAATPAHAAAIESLDHPGKESFYAFVDRAEVVRAEPSASAKKVGKLTLRSPEKTDDLVRVLSRTVVDEVTWLRVSLPVRPNGTTGWVPETALSDLQPVDTWLKINTKTFRATLIKNRKTVWSAPVGVGQSQWVTPKGEFYVRAKLTGYGAAGSVYGPLAFLTSATSPTLTDWPGGGLVGVHGTNQPGLIPGRISHGCVRVRNADILKLDKLMPVGTPITIT